MPSYKFHINKLLQNRYIERANAWASVFAKYIELYDYYTFDPIPDYFLAKKYEQITYGYDVHNREEHFREIFNNYFAELLKAYDYNVKCHVSFLEPSEREKSANLFFRQNDQGAVEFQLRIERGSKENSFLADKNYRIGKDLSYDFLLGIPYVKKIEELEQLLILSPKNLNYETAIWGTIDFREEKSSDIYWCALDQGITITYPPTMTEDIEKAYIEALKLTANDYFKVKNIRPEIYGMEYEKVTDYKYVLKIEDHPNEILPDGESEIEITTTLYRYDLNDESSIGVLEGYPIEFEIVDHKGSKVGTLSAPSLVTNDQGKVTVKYIAPSIEELRKADKEARGSVTIKINNDDYRLEESVIINFKTDKGRTEAYPSAGIIGDHAIVPPDNRFPALIKFRFEGNNSEPTPNKEIIFRLVGNPKHATLKAVDKEISSSPIYEIKTTTDNDGYAEVQYVYISEDKPDKTITDIIEVDSPNSATPFIAKVNVGLNIIFETVENSYEGKGIINAGERIPMRIKIKDAWNPDLDLTPIIDYWGGGGVEGDTPLRVKLEIERLGSVPDYLLDHLQIKRYPIENPFEENMRVRSFTDKGHKNMLWISQASTLIYQGYPCIQPKIAGTSYYEFRVTLTDSKGKEVFPINHPASKAFITITTGVDADKFKIFINLNPFGPHSTLTKALREALGYKYGTVISIADALDAINRGDVESLYEILFSEIKGALLEQLEEVGPLAKESLDAYSKVAFAEKIHFDVMRDETGPLAQMDEAIYNKLKSVFSSSPGQIVILQGEGKQRLKVELKKSGEREEKAKEESSSSINVIEQAKIMVESVKGKVTDAIQQIKGASEVPVKEREFIRHKKLNTLSYKNGNTTIYLIPNNYNLIPENHSAFKKY